MFLRDFLQTEEKKILLTKKMANEKRTTLYFLKKNGKLKKNNITFSIFPSGKSIFFGEILEKSVYYRGVLLMRGFI